MEESNFPGEFEAVVVRMPIKITHSAFVNLHIARVINKGANSLAQLETTADCTSKYRKLLSKVEKAEKVINKYEPVSIVDRVMSQLLNIKASKTLVAAFARYLLAEDKTVQCKKTGIALLGAFGMGRDIPLIMSYATNEEFTFFAVKALKQLMGDGEDFIDTIAEIASKTQGWGKIAAILELPDKIQSKNVKLFLLKNGTQNVIGKYFLSVECAIKGRLYDFLEKAASANETIDGEMSAGICDIFEGMIEAESVKDADSFTEVDGISKIIKDFCFLYENGKIDCKNAKNIYENIKSRV